MLLLQVEMPYLKFSYFARNDNESNACNKFLELEQDSCEPKMLRKNDQWQALSSERIVGCEEVTLWTSAVPTSR